MHTWRDVGDPRSGKGVIAYRYHCALCGYVVESWERLTPANYKSLEFSVPCDFMLVQKIMDA